MMTLGVDLRPREVRLAVVEESGPTLLRAGVMPLAEGALAEVLLRSPEPLATALSERLNMWGVRPHAMTLTLPQSLARRTGIPAAWTAWRRPLGLRKSPHVVDQRTALLTALQRERRPALTVLVNEETTEVIGWPKVGGPIEAQPLPTPSDALAVEIWTPDTPGQALSQWLDDIVARLETLLPQLSEAPVPILVAADPTAYPPLVTLLQGRMANPVRWAAWSLPTESPAKPLVDTMGPRLLPALGAALSSTATPAASQTTSPPVALSVTRQWWMAATWLLWLPLAGWIHLNHQDVTRALAAERPAVEAARAQAARLKTLQTFAAQQSQWQAPEDSVSDAWSLCFKHLPRSLYLTRFETHRKPAGLEIYAQGLTRKPQDVNVWAARLKEEGGFQSDPPRFQFLPPRTRFFVIFRHAVNSPPQDGPWPSAEAPGQEREVKEPPR